MKPALPLSLVLVLAVPAFADAPAAAAGPEVVRAATPGRARGALTGVGITLGSLGLGAAVLATHFSLVASDANRMLAGYYPTPTSAPTVAEAPAVKQLQARRDDAQTFAVASLVGALLAVAGGVTCVVLDTPGTAAPTTVGGLVGPGLAGVMVSGSF